MAIESPKGPDPDSIDPTRSVQPFKEEQSPPEGQSFSTYMQQETPEAQKAPTGPSPMDLAKQGKINASTPPTLDQVKGQMNATSSSLGDIKTQLHTKGLKLKQSQKYLLRSKLESANGHIRSAAEKTGVETGPPVNLHTKKNPITKFLDLVSDGQHQMNQASLEVNKLGASGKQLNPAQLLLIQSKLQKAQQELDYTSVLLGKAVDIIKTLFNVQI